MSSITGTDLARSKRLCRVGGAIGVALLLAIAPSARAADPAPSGNPLGYVPHNAGFFAHVRVAELWNSPLAAEIRKAGSKDLEKALATLAKETGLRPENIDTATFFYPTLPMGPGDETTFVVIGTTTKPIDKNDLFKEIRAKNNAEVKEGMIPLGDKLFLHFPSDTMFVVMHESFIGKFKKGLPVEKQGVMDEALKLADAKHHFVLAIDFSMLPSEILTAAPAELQPFLPLLKSKTSTLFVDLKEKLLSVNLHLTSGDDNSAQDSERSFKLLMKLASDGLAGVLKDEKYVKELGALVAGLKELERAVNTVKISRDGSRLEVSTALNIDMPIAGIVTQTLNKINGESARAQSTNNLKQIALAMHNYHSTYNSFPAAAICGKKGKPLLSWRVSILPFIEQQNLYQQFKLDEPWDSEHNKKLIPMMPRTYALPSDKTPDGKTHYKLFTGNGAVFDLIQQTKITEIADGTSNTLMAVETIDSCDWTKPEDIEFDDKMAIEKLLRFTDGNTPVAFCDGSVRMLKKGIADATWRLLIQKNDAQPIPDLDK